MRPCGRASSSVSRSRDSSLRPRRSPPTASSSAGSSSRSRPSAVVLRALDGVDVEVAVGPGTRIRLNGLPATLADIRPGFVAETVHYGVKPAIRLRAFGRVEPVTERGRLVVVRDSALVLRTGAGRVRIPLTGATLVRRQGRLVAVRILRVGMRVEITRSGDGSADMVRVLRAGA